MKKLTPEEHAQHAAEARRNPEAHPVVIQFGDAFGIVATGYRLTTRLPNAPAGEGRPPPSVVWVECDRACTITTWGDGQGIGAVAAYGPQKSTVLHACPAGVDIPLDAIGGLWLVHPGEPVERWMRAIEAAELDLIKNPKLA